MKKNIAVLAGGYSGEAEISFKSADTVIHNLPKSKYNLYKIIITDNNWKADLDGVFIPVDKNDFSITTGEGKITFDAVFVAIHGTPGEDGLLQAYFELMGIPCTTPSSFGSSLTFDKWSCNQLLKQLGIKSAAAYLLRKNDPVDPDLIIEKTGIPCFVKPNDSGSSLGASKVVEHQYLEPAIKNAFEHGNEVLVETYLKGTEVTCAVYQRKNELVALPLTEIVSKNVFFDFHAKYKGESEEITPARISEELTLKVQSLSKQAFKLLDLKGFVRLDLMIVNEEPYLIEINTVPGLTGESIVPQQVRAAGLSLTDFFDWMVVEAIAAKA